MNSDRRQKLDELYRAAVMQTEPSRSDFVSQACGDDQELRDELESRLRGPGSENDISESPTDMLPADTRSDDDSQHSFPGKTIGQYKILRLLGKGGMGVVYLAVDQELRRNVALKFLPDDLLSDRQRVQRFRQEARAASALNHPNILTIHQIGEYDTRQFIAMEFVEGETLRQIIKARQLSSREVIDFAVQIGSALSAAHAANIMHRDIKPENVIVRPDGYVKVLDFGLAKLSEPTTSKLETSTLLDTQQGMIVGTIQYMSPEQVRGRTVDARTDIWSLGVLLYEMATGKLPFSGETQSDVIAAILERQPPPLECPNAEMASELQPIVTRALRKNADERYQTVKELVDDLRDVGRFADTADRNDQPTKRFLQEQATADAAKGTASVFGSRLTSGFGSIVNQAKDHKAVSFLATTVLATLGIWSFYSYWPGGTATVQARSVVALPCKVFGAEEGRYLEDAVPSTLTTMLGQIGGLEIMAPPTSLEFEQVRGDVNKIVSSYKVNTLVATSVNVDAGRLVLNVQLIDAVNRRVLWSKDFEGQLNTYIDLVKRATEGIRQTIAADSPPVGAPTGLAASSEAELAFRQGKYYSNRYNNQHRQADFDIAFSAFKRALDLDPKLADAAGEIAMLYVFETEIAASPTENAPKIEEWAQRGLNINPQCARALIALGVAEVYSRTSTRKLLSLSLRAAKADPRDSMAPVSIAKSMVFSSGLVALAAARESQRLDPLYLYSTLNMTGALHAIGRVDEAMVELDRLLELEPEMPIGTYAKVLTLAELGRTGEAANLLTKVQKMVDEERLPPHWLHNARFAVAVSSGDPKAADSAMIEILKVVNDPKTSAFDLMDLVTDLVPLMVKHGNREEALQILSRVGNAGLQPPYDYLMWNPLLEPIRSDVRFKSIVAKSKEQFDETMAILNEARSRGELPAYLEGPMAELDRRLSEGKRGAALDTDQTGIAVLFSGLCPSMCGEANGNCLKTAFDRLDAVVLRYQKACFGFA